VQQIRGCISLEVARMGEEYDGEDQEEELEKSNDRAKGQEPPVPSQIKVGGSPVYDVDKGQRLGKGTFGQVYIGRTPQQQEVAIKIELKGKHGPPAEWSVYRALAGCQGVPRLMHTGTLQDYYVMVMELLGPSLQDLFEEHHQRLDMRTVACIACESIAILQNIHDRGYVHCDVKPENFVLGREGFKPRERIPSGSTGPKSQRKRLYLVDLGLAQRWRDSRTEFHKDYNQQPDVFRGTVRYASVHAHLGRQAARRDDMESLGYTLVFLQAGHLPWQGAYQGENKSYYVCKKKMETPSKQLAKGLPEAFQKYFDHVINLRFDEMPNYDYLRSLFLPLTVDPREVATPISMDVSNSKPIVPTRKRKPFGAPGAAEGAEALPAPDGTVDLADEWPEEQRKKKLRMGFVAQQWVTVYNAMPAMKQRYHYNVPYWKVDQHIQKGWGDGLYVSSVGSCDNLWAIIMDAGTGYTQQCYMRTGQFLPKTWISEKWEAGFYITSLAGSKNQSALVCMSKGTGYTQQSYKIQDTFPIKWIQKRLRDGFWVTSLATSGTKWCVVMSRFQDVQHTQRRFLEQAVEIDHMYPSEGIHRRWDRGFRITAMACTPDQCACVLSIPNRRPENETQETLRTSTFPSTHVKEKWSRHLYIANIGYGRTIS